MDRGAWQATVHGAAKSRTRLSTEEGMVTHTHTHPTPPTPHPREPLYFPLWKTVTHLAEI